MTFRAFLVALSLAAPQAAAAPQTTPDLFPFVRYAKWCRDECRGSPVIGVREGEGVFRVSCVCVKNLSVFRGFKR